MKMNSLLLTLLLLVISFSLLVTCAPNEVIKNDKGVIEFELLDGRRIRLPNRHRDKQPSLKFSFHNGVVDKVTKKNTTQSWTLHENDNSVAEFSIEEKSPTVTEYYLLWHGGGPNGGREVCFHYGFGNASWYNAYQSMNSSWPMKTAALEPRQPFNYLFDYDRFNTKGNQHESIMILEHLFINSDGFALLLDPNLPLFVRRDPNKGDPLLCFAVEATYPYREADKEAAYLDIKLRLFASTNVRTVTDYVVHQSGYIPKPNAIPDERMFTNPSWFLWEMNQMETQQAVEHFLNQTLDHGFAFAQSQISLDFWESDYGNYTFAPGRYPHPDQMLTDLKAAKFDVAVPFYGPFLNEPVEENRKKYFMKSLKDIPFNVIDFSNPEACKYYQDKITEKFAQFKQIDTFHLFPHFSIQKDHKLHDPLVEQSPGFLTTKYLETIQKVGRKVISEFAFKTQHLPIFTRLTNHYYEPYVQDLQELISDALSVSIAGYSFIIPYSAGGFFTGFKPTEEVFIRMVQAITFMPSMSFTRRPWQYSEKAMNLTKKFIHLHTEHAQTIIELAKKRIQDGSPIVRPLWYVAPDDAKTYSISDQYMLGEDILVAPVVVIGQTERTIYLISGTWIDQHGKSYQGPGQFKVAAPLEELPYFKRKH